MPSGQLRRSPRIVELERRKAQEAVNKKRLSENDIAESSQRQSTRKVGKASNRGDRPTSAAAVTPGTPLTDITALWSLLDVLKRRDSQKFFAEPVNTAEVEHYADFIKDPMDFATITKTLEQGKYETFEEFEHDVFLVFSNAMLFNGPETVYYRQARDMKEDAVNLFAKLRADPVGFNAEFSMSWPGADRWTPTGARPVNASADNRLIMGRPSGSRVGVDINTLLQRCDTYNPLGSLLGPSKDISLAIQNRAITLLRENHAPHATSSNQWHRSSGHQFPTAVYASGWLFPAPSTNPSENCRTFLSDDMGMRNIRTDGESTFVLAGMHGLQDQSSGVARTNAPIRNSGGNAKEGVHSMNTQLDLNRSFPQDVGYAAIPSNFPALVSTSASPNSSSGFSLAWNTENGPTGRNFPELMQVNNHLRTPEMKPSGMQESLPIRNGGNSQSTYPWYSQDTMRATHDRGIQIGNGFHPTPPNDRRQQSDQSNWRYGGGFGQRGRDSNWIAPTAPRPEPFVNHLLRPEAQPTLIDFLGIMCQQSGEPLTRGARDKKEPDLGDAAQPQQDRKGKAKM